MSKEFSSSDREEIIKKHGSGLIELGLGLKHHGPYSNVAWGLHGSFKEACNAFGTPSFTLIVKRGKETVTISMTNDCMGVGFVSAPVVIYRHMEWTKEVVCVPISVRRDGMHLTVEYDLVAEGAHRVGELHEDGTPCLVDLRSLTVYFDRENEGFPGNEMVAAWDASCVGQDGQSMGKLGSGLDDDFLISITSARTKSRSGKSRGQRRIDTDLAANSLGSGIMSVTFGEMLARWGNPQPGMQVFDTYVQSVAKYMDTMHAIGKDRAKAAVIADTAARLNRDISRNQNRGRGRKAPPAARLGGNGMRAGRDPNNPAHAAKPMPTRPCPKGPDGCDLTLVDPRVRDAMTERALAAANPEHL